SAELAPAVVQPEAPPLAEEPVFEWPPFVLEPLDEEIVQPAPAAPVVTAEPEVSISLDWGVVASAVVAAYAVVATTLLAWWFAGHVALWWTLRRRSPVPERLAALFDELATRRVRLLVSPRARVPFSCGL